MIIKLILILAILISLITDVKSRRILNIVTIPTILFGLIFHAISLGIDGSLFSWKGLLVGGGLLIIPYLLGGIGAGDVKLLAAIGSLMGTVFVFHTFIYTAVIGGVIALVLIIRTRGLKSFFFNVVFLKSSLGSMVIHSDKKGSISFPYGVAIVLGTFCTLVWGGL